MFSVKHDNLTGTERRQIREKEIRKKNAAIDKKRPSAIETRQQIRARERFVQKSRRSAAKAQAARNYTMGGSASV